MIRYLSDTIVDIVVVVADIANSAAIVGTVIAAVVARIIAVAIFAVQPKLDVFGHKHRVVVRWIGPVAVAGIIAVIIIGVGH